MLKIKLSGSAIFYLWVPTITLLLYVLTALTLAFGFPDFTCAHAPFLTLWADNFLWLCFVNTGVHVSASILDSNIRYTELPDELPDPESDEDSLGQRAELESAFGRYDRYILASAVFLITFLVTPWVRLATVGMVVDCTQWKAAANGGGLQ
ncbi:hypothetical protein D0862_10424 [Hortaea werneckii]|uniref:Uncharacterized protein n=1 Tax=Hortaea werneckii TaxID=91943 RepID=A0A3M7FJS2_HORWE|nr:hypothetical protein KC320_g7662 [Hortaea werneckii]RMY88544.1 hypothetical protein D0862_10424 [Hortaea werneckii]